MSHSVYFWSSANFNSPFSHLHSSEHGLISKIVISFVFFICNKPEVLFRLKRWVLPIVKRTAHSDIKVVLHILYVYSLFYYSLLVIFLIVIIFELWFLFVRYLPIDLYFYLPLVCMFLMSLNAFRFNVSRIAEWEENALLVGRKLLDDNISHIIYPHGSYPPIQVRVILPLNIIVYPIRNL